MPGWFAGLVHATGQADGIYPLNDLAWEITRRVLRSREPRALLGSAPCVGSDVEAK